MYKHSKMEEWGPSSSIQELEMKANLVPAGKPTVLRELAQIINILNHELQN